MPEPSPANSETHTISEAEFIKLCDDVYADRQQIYQFNPNASRREALLWMLTGCLISLLSVPILEQPSADGTSSADPYADAIREILRNHMQTPFDPQAHLAELSKKLEKEQGIETL
jgi:hypothetical protein